MTYDLRLNLMLRQSLSEQERTHIRALADICTSYEDLDLRLNWSEMQSQNTFGQYILAYHEDMLIGFLMLEGVGSEEAESSGMVHVRYRRRGVFSSMIAAAQALCSTHGCSGLLCLYDTRSKAASAALKALGATPVFAEHVMRLETALVAAPAEALDFRLATLDDIDTIVQIGEHESESDELYFRQMISQAIQGGARQYYVARLDGAPVGTINVDWVEGEPYIYGFVVRPEYRGRGYGREIIARTIALLMAKGVRPVYLEVETENTPALSLYRSLGFAVIRTFSYTKLAVPAQE